MMLYRYACSDHQLCPFFSLPNSCVHIYFNLLLTLITIANSICHHEEEYFFFIDNKSFIDEKEQCVYDCKLTVLETNTIKS